MSTAIRENRPIVLDFYADWCLPCQELDRTVFCDDRVVRFSRQYAMLRVDLTHRQPKQNEILDQFDVRGVPTILFFNRNGIEEKDLRIESIVNTQTFLKRMEALWKSVPPLSP
jgi:thiol:disulfide interchange protein DsbD